MPRHSSLPYRDCVRRPHVLRPADGRRARFGVIAFWVTAGALLTMAAWSMTSATYSAFREDVLAGSLARQAEMQSAYEDRIAELRAQVDRFSSRQLIDQEQYEKKLEQILRRQTALESRAGALRARRSRRCRRQHQTACARRRERRAARERAQSGPRQRSLHFSGSGGHRFAHERSRQGRHRRCDRTLAGIARSPRAAPGRDGRLAR